MEYTTDPVTWFALWGLYQLAEDEGYKFPAHSWQRGYWFSVQRGIKELIDSNITVKRG